MAKILLVGSDESAVESVTKILEDNGFDVATEMSAKDGLDRIGDEFFPGCVVNLPREESLWFLIKVRALHKVAASSTPILVLADDRSEELSEYVESGATKVIRKHDASTEKLGVELRKIMNIPRMGILI
jgi:DNA-binding response OmpR family regulator